MIYRSVESNPFEFAVVAALRAKQLMAGCVPRVLPAQKATSTASLEVLAGKVSRIPALLLPLIPPADRRVTTDAPQLDGRPVSPVLHAGAAGDLDAPGEPSRNT